MIKALIICNNFEVIKRLINKILYKIENLKIIGIVNSLDLETEALEKEVNLVITNNKSTVSTILKNKNLDSIRIIFISFSNIKFFDNKNILEINYLAPNNTISNSLSYFINTSFNNSSKQKVIRILKHLGFDFKLVGTLYLVDSIIYIHSFKGFSFETLQRDIYPYIANLNNTSVNRIKWSIERTIKYLYIKKTDETINSIYHYFGIKYPDKLTPKLIINFIANNL